MHCLLSLQGTSGSKHALWEYSPPQQNRDKAEAFADRILVSLWFVISVRQSRSIYSLSIAGRCRRKAADMVLLHEKEW